MRQMLMQGKEFKMKVKAKAPPSRTMREAMKLADKAELKAAQAYAGMEEGTAVAAPAPDAMERSEETEEEAKMPKTNTYFKTCKAENKMLATTKALEASVAQVAEAEAELAKASAAVAEATSDEEKAAAAEIEAAAKKAVEDSSSAAKDAEVAAAKAKAALEKCATDLAIEQAAMAAAASEELGEAQPQEVTDQATKLAEIKARSEALAAVKEAAALIAAGDIDPNTSAARDLFQAAAADYDSTHTTAPGVRAATRKVATKYIWRNVGGVWKKVPPSS